MQRQQGHLLSLTFHVPTHEVEVRRQLEEIIGRAQGLSPERKGENLARIVATLFRLQGVPTVVQPALWEVRFERGTMPCHIKLERLEGFYSLTIAFPGLAGNFIKVEQIPQSLLADPTNNSPVPSLRPREWDLVRIDQIHAVADVPQRDGAARSDWIPTKIYHFLLELLAGCGEVSLLQRRMLRSKLDGFGQGGTGNRPAFVNATVLEKLYQSVLHTWTLNKSDPRRSLCNGALFHGLPGTGKSEVAKFVAQELGFQVIFLGSPQSLVDKYFGETEKQIERLFESSLIFPNIPTIVGFEEFDSISSSRTGNISASELGWRSALLHRLGNERYPNLLVICTSNDLMSIDPAFVREGRLGTKVYFGRPGPNDQLTILASNFRVSGFVQAAEAITPNGAQRNAAEIAYLNIAMRNFSGAQVKAVQRETIRLITSENENNLGEWNNPTWAQVSPFLDRALRTVVTNAHSPDVLYFPRPEGAPQPAPAYVPELRRIFGRFFPQMSGRILFDLSTSRIWVEFRDGSGYPLSATNAPSMRPSEILQSLTCEFHASTSFLVDCQRSSLFDNHPNQANTQSEAFIEECRYAGKSGGSIVAIDMDDLVGISERVGVQSGMSGAQSRNVQAATSRSWNLLREYCFSNVNSASVRMAFSEREDCYSLVVAFSRYPFMCSQLETSWNTRVQLSLDSQLCPRSIHLTETQATMDTPPADVPAAQQPQPGCVRTDITLKSECSYLLSVVVHFKTNGFVSLGIAQNDVDILAIDTGVIGKAASTCGFKIESNQFSVCNNTVDKPVANPARGNNNGTFALFFSFPQLILLKMQDGGAGWQVLAAQVVPNDMRDICFAFGLGLVSGFEISDCRKVNKEWISMLPGWEPNSFGVDFSFPDQGNHIVCSGPLEAHQRVGGWNSVLSKGLQPGHRYYIQTNIAHTDGNGHMMIGFWRVAVANLTNARNQHIGQSPGGIAYYVHGHHTIYDTINNRTVTIPGLRMTGPFVGRDVGLLLDLTEAAGFIHLFFNDAPGGPMVHRGLLAGGLPREVYRFGVSLHTAGDRVTWTGFQDGNIPPAIFAAMPPA